MLQDNCMDCSTRVKCYEIEAYSHEIIVDRINRTTFDDYWWCVSILDVQVIDDNTKIVSPTTLKNLVDCPVLFREVDVF